LNKRWSSTARHGHFGALLILAQLQLRDDKYAEALATIDRFLTETRPQPGTSC
jgi:outer membrane protein assembly factor BamD (BamD/ComL family)